MPTLISRRNPSPILGVMGGIFHFYLNFNRTYCKQTVAVFDLGLLDLPMSHKKDARIIWIKEQEM